MALKDLSIHIRIVQKVRQELAAARNALAEFDRNVQNLGKTQVAQKTADSYKKYVQQVQKADKANIKLNKSLNRADRAFSKLDKKLKQTQKQMKQTEEATTAAAKGMDKMKAQTRLTAEGFVAMLKSQAAWLAGFTLIFTPIYAMIDALREAINVQNEWARAVRVLRSDTKGAGADIAGAYTAMTGEMIRTGKTAAEVTEVIYQLGSAGLYDKEIIAALGSTMNTMIGTEADLTTMTKIIAGVYNNMGEAMYKTADGSVKFATSLQELNNPMNQQITLQEKFTAINDQLVRVFREHQVEMGELNDGLKYSIATARAAGVGFTELLGVLATLNDHMIKAGIAGRSFQAMLSRIAKYPKKFAKAFDIKINEKEPLKLIDILEQIAAKQKSGVLTVGEMGKAFSRLGLRGAKTFITLVENVEELKENIDDLGTHAEGASEKMAKIMLDRPIVTFERFKREIALLIGVLSKGFIIVLNSVGKAFNAVAMGIHTLNEASGGLIGTTAAFVSFAAAAVGLTAALVALAASTGLVAAAISFLIGIIVTIVEFLAILGAAIAIIAGIVWLVKKVGDSLATHYGKSIKKANEETEKFVDLSKKEQDSLKDIAREAFATAASIKELYGIRSAGSLDAYIGAQTQIDIINQHINETLFHRQAILGKVQAINGTILEQAKNKRDMALLGIRAMDEEEATAANIKKEIKGMVADVKIYNDFLQQSVAQMNDILTFSTQLARNRRVFNFSDNMVEEVQKGTGRAESSLKRFYDGLANISDKNITLMGDHIISLLQKFKDGEMTLLEFRTIIGNYPKVVGKSMEAAIKGIVRLDGEISKNIQSIKDLATEYANLQISTIRGAESIERMFGFGAEAAYSAVDSIDANKKAIEDLEREYQAAIAERDKFTDPSDIDKWREAQNKVLSIYEQIFTLESKNSKLHERSSEILRRKAIYIAQESRSLKEAIALQREYSDAASWVADDTEKSLEARARAMDEEKARLKKIKDYTIEMAKLEKEQVKVQLAQRVIDQEQADKKMAEIRDKYIKKITRIEGEIGDATKDRIDLEIEKGGELYAKQKMMIDSLDAIKSKYKEVMTVVGKKLDRNVFDQLTDSTKEAIQGVLDIQAAIDDLHGKKVEITVEEKHKRTDEAAKQFGGFIDRPLLAKVSAGEGFVPPGAARRNLAALSALNQGSVTPSARNIGISRFSGPSGVDNIKTLLPSGSFVISRKGMAAYDAAISSRERFQMGGMAVASDGGVSMPNDSEQSARFDLVLNIGGEEKTYPVFGTKKTIDALSDELEKQNLTRL